MHCTIADILTDTKEEVRNTGLFGCWTFKWFFTEDLINSTEP
jgi:hypothetical protein